MREKERCYLMKIRLKEAPFEEENYVEDFTNDTPEVQAPLDLEVVEPETTDEESIFIDETDPKLTEFICSDALNELRDILIELPEDIHLLLLDNKVIVIARNSNDEKNETFLYCLRDEDDEFTLIQMPLKLDEILANDSIIQYTPANISDVHDKVMELFARELEPEDEEIEEEVIEDIPEESIEDNIDNDLEEDTNDEIEEEDEDEEDKIGS